MKKLMIILIVILLGSPVQAGYFFMPGNELVQLMKQYENKSGSDPVANTYDSGEYLGYVLGVFDYLSVSGVFCPPNGVTVGQAVNIVSKFLKDKVGSSRASTSVFFLPGIQ